MSTEFSLNGSASNSTSLNGSCNLCGKKADCRCDRCGDFYCSKQCQLNDWRNHRFICFPMPKLVKAGHDVSTENSLPKLAVKKPENSPKFAKSKESAAELPSGSCVILTAFKSLNCCFICSTNPTTLEEREKILNEINAFGKTASPLTSKHGDFALTLRNEKWCRVKVLSRNKGKGHMVVFTDFGEKTYRTQEELRKCPATIRNFPCHTQTVQLNGIKVNSTSEKILDSLTQFTNKEYKIEYTKPDGNGGNVELFKWGSSISLNSLIQEMLIRQNTNIDNISVASSNVEEPKINVAESKETNNYKNKGSSNGAIPKRYEKAPSQGMNKVENVIENGLVPKTQTISVKALPRHIEANKPCLVPPFETIPINENDHGSEVIIMDNSFLESGYIGCLLAKYYENLKAVTDYLVTHKLDDQPPYKPQYGEYCLAKFDDMWYRAKVEEVVSEDLFLVVYIDFTNECELSSKLIRRYPMSLDFACCTTLCGIDGLPDPIPAKLFKTLEKEVKAFTSMKIDSIRKKDSICYLKSDALLHSLISQD